MKRLPPFETMYRALLRRDAAFEGVFCVGVKTTGVFCRPTCGARKPLARNVEFFGSAQEAILRGYRPCRKCDPTARESPTPQPVRKLLESVNLWPTDDAAECVRRAGVGASSARRVFRRYFGMTFHQYHRARRMGMALRELEKGETVTSAALRGGFESLSGFGAAFRRTFGRSPKRAKDEVHVCLQMETIETPLGPMVAVADDAALRLLEFADRRALQRELGALAGGGDRVLTPGRNAILASIAGELRRYFAGGLRRFETPLALEGSPFELAVWRELLTIPPGTTRSYADMARALGRPGASRAVGRANGANRLAIIVPCHRVVRADGTLCGYGGGVWRKRWLLEHERGEGSLGMP